MITDVIQQFLQEYGLSGTTIQEGESLNFMIDTIGALQLVHKAPHFLIGLNRKLENFYLLNARKILAHAHFNEQRIKPLHAQLHNDTLGFYYIFQEQEIDVSLLSNALDSLAELMDQVFQNL